jgi:hypothetical protein
MNEKETRDEAGVWHVMSRPTSLLRTPRPTRKLGPAVTITGLQTSEAATASSLWDDARVCARRHIRVLRLDWPEKTLR